MSIRIIKAGVLDTIQDQGRYGFQYIGVNPSGAMDKFSSRVANILAGNDPTEALIEMHFPASVILFQQPALIALSGADFSACIDGDPVPLNHPIIVSKNSVLQFREPVSGARVYLAIHGGLKIEQWLNSSSTNLKAKAGGLEGRGFQKNDEIFFNDSHGFSFLLKERDFMVLPWQADTNWHDPAYPDEVFVLPGMEWERLNEESKKNFFTREFIIAPASDRMGYRLKTKFLDTTVREEIVSSAVNFGSIQWLPGKQLIILMADHQTTGGYPRLAHIISAHHPKVAQMKVGEAINFRPADQQTAENLLLEQHRHLLLLQNASKFRLDEFFRS
jgi:antagonist of KipI